VSADNLLSSSRTRYSPACTRRWAGAKKAMLSDRRTVSLKGIDEPVEVATIAWRTT
jgi:hypothetical protein